MYVSNAELVTTVIAIVDDRSTAKTIAVARFLRPSRMKGPTPARGFAAIARDVFAQLRSPRRMLHVARAVAISQKKP